MAGCFRKTVIQAEYTFDSLSQVTWPSRQTGQSIMMGTSEGTDSPEVFRENGKVQDLLFNKYIVHLFDLVNFPLRILLIP